MTARGTATSANVRIRAGITWALVYTILWALLGQGRGWSFGIPLIVGAVALSDWLRLYPVRVRLHRVPFFISFFLHRLLRGGLDVSLRTLHRNPARHAGWVTYRLSPDSSPDVRLLISAITGMLPGTLAARIDNDVMHMHILDTSMDWRRDTRALEQHLVRLIGNGALL